ncbi:hypothetical protein FSC37_18655 [Piscinibacter aquaticus]|uniref:Uncharacterized protein n=1 Tax=Piscinibacter aquaticus TaxID=392597 RepID=A0A5C6U1V5_9BURK|nr:hypothetical protein FSC37_18655 [Piscinibacter aquaticus]
MWRSASQRRLPQPRQPAGAGAGRRGPRPAGRHAALRQCHAGRAVDGRRLVARHRQRQCGAEAGLALPLADLPASTVKGSLALAGNDVRMTPDTPLMAGARARIDFTQKGLTITGATARMLGGEASFDGSTQPDGSLRFSGQGTATAEGLRRASELGVLSRTASHFSGRPPTAPAWAS